MKDKMSNDSLIQAITILIQNPALVDVVLDHYTAPKEPVKVEKKVEKKVVKKVYPLSSAKQLRNSRILMGHGMGALKHRDTKARRCFVEHRSDRD